MTFKLLGLLIAFSFCSQVFGQYILITPDGKTVKLNANGTWKFIEQKKLNEMTSVIPKNSTSKYISHYKKYEFWYDPSQWIIDTTKKTNSFTWDALFYSNDYALQGYCINSRLSMPVENIEAGIRDQWKSSGEIKLFSSYKDTINNLPITIFDMEYFQAGVTYKYKGIVHSDLKGSFELMVGTQKEIFLEDKDKIDLLLKGLIKL